ncbi:MAG TPA: hybrid sensor histidine kinase/response regulator, partial [Candidatus Paceibacterota bacterium]
QDFCVHLGIVLENARLYAEVERRDKAKDLFLASLSHELRNPLAPIKSSLELLKMKGTAPDIREELDIIEHQFDHMARLLNDLLDVTRFTQDKIEITMQSVGLRRLIEKALRATDALLKESGIRLSVHLPDTSIPVMADETRLEQALINVLTNAIKYTPSGGSIQVTLQHDATTAYITVRDDGIGIPAEDLANIFKMYYQGKRRAIDASGLGIGLLLVRKIVELHGGTVAARSEGSGQGSEFEITVPLSKEAAPAPDSVPTNHSITGKRILVVDDNAPAADALVRLLNKLGADAEARYSGAEALCAPRLDEFDVMLLDLGMPQMDGFEVARQMRQKGLTAPVVALTGYGMLEDKERTRDAGFSAHLTKPVGLRELTALFETV